MQILVDFESDLVAEIIKFDSDETFETNLIELVTQALEQNVVVVLTNDEINELVHDLIEFIIRKSDKDQLFILPAIFKMLPSKPYDANWVNLHPTTRKTIGKRFRQAIREHEKNADDGDLIIEFHEKTAQNTALYKVTEKAGW